MLPEIGRGAKPGEWADNAGEDDEPDTEGQVRAAPLLHQVLHILRGQQQEHHGHPELGEVDGEGHHVSAINTGDYKFVASRP